MTGWLDNVLVSTINDADWGLAGILLMTPPALRRWRTWR